jgi:NADH-quinone oxidoreductase subunit E
VARFTSENEERAREAIALYPQPRSAMLPLFHLAQEQDGYLTRDAMLHIAELVGVTAADVYGTATFYDMLFLEPVGRWLIAICTNLACMLDGAYELMEHAESTLGINEGATTKDGQFTLEEVECIALCDEAPCLTVNWRFFGRTTPESFDRLVDDLRAGNLDDRVPPHGTLCRVRRTVGLTAGVPAEGRVDYDREQPAAPESEAPPPPEAPERAGPEREMVGDIPTIASEEGAEVLGPPGADETPERRGGLSEAARKEAEAQAEAAAEEEAEEDGGEDGDSEGEDD